MLQKRAFSLLELMIVVLIMGLVFSLVKVQFHTPPNEKSGIEILKTFSQNQDEQLICYDECSKCAIFDMNESKKSEINFKKFDNELKSYYIDYDGDVLEYEYKDIKIEDRSFDVCLKYRYFKNNSSQKLIIKYFDNYYLFHSFFRNYEIFNSLDDAQTAYINEDEFPQDEEGYQGRFR